MSMESEGNAMVRLVGTLDVWFIAGEMGTVASEPVSDVPFRSIKKTKRLLKMTSITSPILAGVTF